ncbi:hypothetical protein V2J09_019548 [Rumex salicifolius]
MAVAYWRFLFVFFDILTWVERGEYKIIEEMAEEIIIVEVEPESIKSHLIDVNVSSPLLNEESPDNIKNSEHFNIVVKDTIDSAKDEDGNKKDAKKSLVWDMKMDDAHHVRRNSASLLFGESKKFVVRSRYRGGSIGSCHDMCKFGHGNTPEVKPNSHLNKTPLSISASQGKGLMKTVSSVDNRKKSVVVRRLSFPKEKPTTDHSVKTVNNKQEEKPIVVDEKRSLKDEKSLRSKPNVKKAASMNSRVHRDLSSSSRLRNVHQTRCQQEVKAKLPEDLPEKTLYMIEPNGKCAPPEISQKAPPFQSNRLPKTQGGSSYIGTRKGSKATQNGMSKSLFPSSSKSFKMKTEKLKDTELVIKHTHKYKSSTQEATSYSSRLKLGAPKTKQNGKQNSHLIKPLLSDKPSKSEEEMSELSKNGDSMSGNSKTKPNTTKAKPSNSTPRSKPGTPKVKQAVEPKVKASTRGPKSQNGEGQSFVSVWKMKFRRGKVVSLPSGNNSPVKLKFRRPRVLNDSCHVARSGNTNYKSIEVVGDDTMKDHGAEAVKVVLRRHEATCKKDDVDLNNVIEETASKLVKTRKSKVKALVGAFETVMSLRDHKAGTDTL